MYVYVIAQHIESKHKHTQGTDGHAVPSVRQKVHLDIGVTGSSVGSGWQVYGLKDVDNELMAHFVIPQFNLYKL